MCACESVRRPLTGDSRAGYAIRRQVALPLPPPPPAAAGESTSSALCTDGAYIYIHTLRYTACLAYLCLSVTAFCI